jgi:glycosyltransferase involved in cell wall biosynthesis
MLKTKKKQPLPDKIVLVTNGYPCVPYNQEFVFIESELESLRNKFSEVIIIANVTGKEYEEKENVIVYDYYPSFFQKLLVLFKWCFWREVIVEFRVSKSINYNKLKIATSYLSKALAFKSFIQRFDAPVYTFWLTELTLGGILAKKKVVSRAHGFDVYNDLHPENYLPFRKALFSKLRLLSFISKAGYNHASTLHGGGYASFDINYLGIQSALTEPNLIDDRKGLHIVSCSGIIPLKRVDLILDTLSELECDVYWTHFGFGPLLEDMRKKVGEVKKNNLHIKFPGKTKNKDVLRFMVEVKPDFFINASTSEGIPVSIIEALSLSVPAIAPDVGGVKEALVYPEQFLVSVNNYKEEALNAIASYIKLSVKQKNQIRVSAFEKYKSSFVGDQNNSAFFEKVKLAVK